VDSLITVLAVKSTPTFKHLSVVIYPSHPVVCHGTKWIRKSRQCLLSLLQEVDVTLSDFVFMIDSFTKL